MRFFFGFLLFISSLFFSCNFDSVKTSSSGKPGELIIVIDSANWKGETGSTLRDSLLLAIPGLPREEPSLTVVTVSHGQFKNLLQHHRNILMIETGPVSGNKPYALTLKRDVWSTPQLVLNLRAGDVSQLPAAVLAMASTIRERFLDEDRDRLMEKLRHDNISKVTTAVKSHLGISIPLSEDYFVAKTETNYMWIRKETANSSFGFQVYKYPYTNDSAFTTEAMMNIRDSLSQKYIPGPLDGSYMTTDRNYPLTVTSGEISECYSVQIKGLWRTEGDFMGGPFLSYLLLNKNKPELLFIDAYIYAPKFNKREYVRQMDAMVHALTFVE